VGDLVGTCSCGSSSSIMGCCTAFNFSRHVNVGCCFRKPSYPGGVHSLGRIKGSEVRVENWSMGRLPTLVMCHHLPAWFVCMLLCLLLLCLLL